MSTSKLKKIVVLLETDAANMFVYKITDVYAS